jgi:hypothetical protein
LAGYEMVSLLDAKTESRSKLDGLKLPPKVATRNETPTEDTYDHKINNR